MESPLKAELTTVLRVLNADHVLPHNPAVDTFFYRQ